jgi:hypothetical protein
LFVPHRRGHGRYADAGEYIVDAQQAFRAKEPDADRAPARHHAARTRQPRRRRPSELLGGELKEKGAPNRAKLYPVFGDKDNHADGHGGCAVRSSAVWSAGVAEFVDRLIAR